MQLVCCAIIKFLLYSTGCDRVKYNDWIKQIKWIEFQSGQTIMKQFEQFYAELPTQSISDQNVGLFSTR